MSSLLLFEAEVSQDNLRGYLIIPHFYAFLSLLTSSLPSLTHLTSPSLTHLTLPSLTHLTSPSLTHLTSPSLTHLSPHFPSVFGSSSHFSPHPTLSRSISILHCRSNKPINACHSQQKCPSIKTNCWAGGHIPWKTSDIVPDGYLAICFGVVWCGLSDQMGT